MAVDAFQHAHDCLLDGGIFVERLAPFGQLLAERKGRRRLLPHALATPKVDC